MINVMITGDTATPYQIPSTSMPNAAGVTSVVSPSEGAAGEEELV